MNSWTRFLGTTLFAAAVASLPLPAAAIVAPPSPYSGLYVFGDSLSDIGRVSALTGGYPGPAFGYAAGRFSNGPVAVETLALSLTGSPLSISHDFAFGGARTGTSPFSGSDNYNPALNGTGLLNQTAMFRGAVGAGQADPNALYVVWAGANDFTELEVLTNQGGNQWGRVIGNLQSAIGNLAADGARHFLVPNLPNLGLAPYAMAGGPEASAGASLLSGGFNAMLGASLSAFDAANPNIDLRVFDVYGFMTSFIGQVNANGSHLGISNVTGQCQSDPACNDPNQYFFWDDRHPTARAHEILGAQFAAAVPEAETWAMLLAGLGLIGMRARRRGSVVA